MEYATLEEFKDRAGYLIDGLWYPRVTSIVAIKAKPALLRYYGGMRSFKAADDAKEASAREGTLVHEAVAAIAAGRHDVVVDALVRPSVDAFTEFLRNSHVEPLLIEERVVSRKHGYAGTVDMVARVNGVVGVLDIKTGKRIYRDYGMQTAAYVAAVAERGGEVPTTSWVLRLDQGRICELCGVTLRTKGGTFRVSAGGKGCTHRWGPMQGQFEFVELPDTERNMHAFLASKQLWEWEHHEFLTQLIS